MSRFHSGRVLTLAAIWLALGACGDSAGPSNQAQVNFNVATQSAPVVAAGTSLGVVGSPETFTDGTNTLVVTGVQVVLGEIELHRAGVTSDCLDGVEDDCEELEIGPVLVDLPLGTPGAARTFSTDLVPGTYDRVDLEIHKPSGSSDAAFLQAHPEFENVSVRVTGTYNGEGFTYTGDLDIELEFNLVPELTVGETATTDLTLFVSLDSWFRDQGGTLLHPASANPGGANESIVEENIKNSLKAFKDDDHDGRDDGPSAL
ncbi:MAG TPA: hypothetical protein VFU40_05965 [Gemmatimonadales bacterium]|nr:hypothetical protein [Gemmatimonadales bacterium]